MAVEQFVMSAYATIVSWTYVLLVILIIVKIIQFFSGGSLFGGEGGKDSTSSRDRVRDDVSPDDKRKRKEDEKNGKSEGLDVEKPGFVQVLVWDEDNNPVQGAKISITPARMHKRRWLRTKKDWREYGDLTGPDGVWPGAGKYETIGSGSVTIEVTKSGLFNWGWFYQGRFYQKKDYEILPNEKHEIVVIMGRQGEKAEWFEPKILDVNVTDQDIKLKGIIN